MRSNVMEIIELIFRSFAQLVFFPVFGALSLFLLNPFSWLYIGVIGVLFAVQLRVPKGIRNIIIAALSLGIMMMWVALFISDQKLPNGNDLTKPEAAGGFPIMGFEYPPPALGGNTPPLDSWGLFYLNLVFWIVAGASIAIIFRKYSNKQTLFNLFAASFLVSLYGLGYLFAKFD